MQQRPQTDLGGQPGIMGMAGFPFSVCKGHFQLKNKKHSTRNFEKLPRPGLGAKGWPSLPPLSFRPGEFQEGVAYMHLHVDIHDF